jgi:hypothetical protein
MRTPHDAVLIAKKKQVEKKINKMGLDSLCKETISGAEEMLGEELSLSQTLKIMEALIDKNLSKQ